MPGPTATAGVVGVMCSSATDRTTATAVPQRRVGLFPHQNPPKSPLVQGGTLFSSTVASPSGMRNSRQSPPWGGRREGEVLRRLHAVAERRGGSRPRAQPTPGPDGPYPSQEWIGYQFLCKFTLCTSTLCRVLSEFLLETDPDPN